MTVNPCKLKKECETGTRVKPCPYFFPFNDNEPPPKKMFENCPYRTFAVIGDTVDIKTYYPRKLVS